MTDDIPRAAILAARHEGAHDDCIAFIREYPESSAAQHVASEHEHGTMDRAVVRGGGFFRALWEDGAREAYGTAGESNTDRLEVLFGEGVFRGLSNPYRAAATPYQ